MGMSIREKIRAAVPDRLYPRYPRYLSKQIVNTTPAKLFFLLFLGSLCHHTDVVNFTWLK